jgi:hypothetical protein
MSRPEIVSISGRFLFCLCRGADEILATATPAIEILSNIPSVSNKLPAALR